MFHKCGLRFSAAPPQGKWQHHRPHVQESPRIPGAFQGELTFGGCHLPSCCLQGGEHKQSKEIPQLFYRCLIILPPPTPCSLASLFPETGLARSPRRPHPTEANGSNAKPMAPTCADSSDRGSSMLWTRLALCSLVRLPEWSKAIGAIQSPSCTLGFAAGAEIGAVFYTPCYALGVGRWASGVRR